MSSESSTAKKYGKAFIIVIIIGLALGFIIGWSFNNIRLPDASKVTINQNENFLQFDLFLKEDLTYSIEIYQFNSKIKNTTMLYQDIFSVNNDGNEQTFSIRYIKVINLSLIKENIDFNQFIQIDIDLISSKEFFSFNSFDRIFTTYLLNDFA